MVCPSVTFTKGTPLGISADDLQELGNNFMASEKPLGVETLVDLEEIGIPSRGKPSPKFPLGREVFDRKGFALYQAQPLESKRELLRKSWLDVSYLALGRTTSLALTLQKKDFGRLVQLLTSAGIAYDKVFPKDIAPNNNTLVFNLFKGLPSDRLLRVVGQVSLPSDSPLEGKPLEGIPLDSTVSTIT